MIGLQETKQIMDKPDYKQIVSSVKAYQDKGFFEYNHSNPFGTGSIQEKYNVAKMNRSDADKIAEMIKTVPLKHLLKEFLAQSSTTGIGGAAYRLVAHPLHHLEPAPAVPRGIANVR